MFWQKCGKEFERNELFCRRRFVQFLEKYHGFSMNLKALKRRLREKEKWSPFRVREIIKREIEGPLSLLFLKTEQLYHNEILFQSTVQWQISHLTSCATHFSVRVSLKCHIDGRIAHCYHILFHICSRTS